MAKLLIGLIVLIKPPYLSHITLFKTKSFVNHIFNRLSQNIFRGFPVNLLELGIIRPCGILQISGWEKINERVVMRMPRFMTRPPAPQISPVMACPAIRDFEPFDRIARIIAMLPKIKGI